MPLGGRLQVLERGDTSLSSIATAASRVTIGHSEGMPLAFANLYVDIANKLEDDEAVQKKFEERPLYPDAEDGLRSIAAVHAAEASSKEMGKWMPAVPFSLKPVV